MRIFALFVSLLLAGCSTTLQPIEYREHDQLSSFKTLGKVEWVLTSPIKPEVTYEDNKVVLDRRQFRQLIDLYKYALAREQDVNRLIALSNTVIEDRNNLLELAKGYEAALNAAQKNHAKEREDRIADNETINLQINVLRIMAAVAVGYAL